MPFLCTVRLGRSAYLAILLSILGLLFISVIGTGVSSFQPAGFILALASAFTYSFYIFGNEYFGIGEYPVWSAVFYMAAASACVFIVINAVTGQFTLPAGGAAMAMPLAQPSSPRSASCCSISGIAGAGAAQASFATLIEPVASVICGVIVLNEKVTLFTIIGIVLILLSVWVNSMHTHEKAPAREKAPAK